MLVRNVLTLLFVVFRATTTGWSLTLLRNVLDAAVPQQTGALPPDAPRWQALAVSASEALRFPALCANSVTVAAWWLALVPLLYSYQKTREAKRAFMEWNLSPFLLNVHALNMPLAAAAHLLSPRRLSRADLWAGLALSYAYLLFYLRRLDARGLHFYIILSPRTRWAPAVYAAYLGLGYGLWRAWDAASVWMVEHTDGPWGC